METTTDTNTNINAEIDTDHPVAEHKTNPDGADNPFTPPPPMPQERRLERSSDGRLGGVAGGLANYLGIDPTLVRIGLVLGTLMYGSGLLMYLAAWLIIPPAPSRALSPPPPMVYG